MAEDPSSRPEGWEELIPPAKVENQLDVMREFIRLQTEELQLKREQHQLALREQSDGYEFAKASLQAQTSDRQQERQYNAGLLGKRFWFAGLMILCFLIFSGFAMYLDKEALIEEIGKAVVYLTAGALGGYGYAQKKSKSKDGAVDNE